MQLHYQYFLYLFALFLIFRVNITVFQLRNKLWESTVKAALNYWLQPVLSEAKIQWLCGTVKKQLKFSVGV